MVEQPLGVFDDTKEPLRDTPLFDRSITALAAPLYYLLVG